MLTKGAVLRAALVLLLVARAGMASAWGEMGHRVSALIAADLLTPAARSQLQRIMDSDDIEAMSVYLDRQREALEQRMPGSRQWHFDNRPVCNDRMSRRDYCPGGDCASAQLSRHLRVLGDRAAPLEARRLAVHVVIHVLGDIHQPLHAADDGDLGGNRMRVSLPWGAADANANLHSLWDSLIIERMVAGRTARHVAQTLRERFAPQAKAWAKGGVRDWMAESHALARAVAYSPSVGFVCGNADEERVNPVPAEYVAAAEPVIERQLARAGYRIARVLNRALR